MSPTARFETPVYQSSCTIAARGLLLLSLVYVTWRFGGVDTITQWHLAWMLLATIVLAWIGQRSFGLHSRPLPTALLAVIAFSIAWPVFQTLPLPQPIYNFVATGQHEIDSSLVGQTNATLATILTDEETKVFPRQSISIVRSLSQQRVAHWVLMAAYVLLAAMLFDTRKSRNVFLWTLAINTGVIATWGLIQRTTGSIDLLPGATRGNVTMPFGPFIYKNAGAAAIIPGLAAAIALLWAQWMPRGGQKFSPRDQLKSSASRYRSTTASGDQRATFLLALSGLTSAGLLISYSRGAWLAVIIATIVILVATRDVVPKRLAAVLVIVPIIVCTFVVALTSGWQPIADRLESQLTADYVQSDARWQHWQEGFRTAQKYFPVGSGIGTYGYATLAEQQLDSRLWFREAHNHYLETLTEQGLPGLLVLLAGGLLLMRYGYRLLVNEVSRQRSAIGLFGLATLVAIAVQSVVDFVVIIPAVMFVLAAAFGVVAGTYVAPLNRNRARRVRREVQQTPSQCPVPALWLAPLCVGLLIVQFSMSSDLTTEHALRASSLPTDRVPSDIAITANLDRLNETIDQHPTRAALYQRRAAWNVIKLRLALRRASIRAGNEMNWESTSLRTLFQKVMALPAAEQSYVIDDMAINPKIREPLRSVLADLQTSISLNPTVPACHLDIALLAPAVGVSPAVANENLARLALSNPRLQFMVGLIAHFLNDHERMLDQWRRSLRGTTPELDQMVQLCLNTMTVAEITKRLIPADRSELLLPMLLSLNEEQLTNVRASGAVTRLIEQTVMADETQPVSKRYAINAWLAVHLDRDRQAANHWEGAVTHDRDNSDYRFQYCRSLLKVGNYQELFKQCSLGQSLEPRRERFGSLVDKARQQMKASDR